MEEIPEDNLVSSEVPTNVTLADIARITDVGFGNRVPCQGPGKVIGGVL